MSLARSSQSRSWRGIEASVCRFVGRSVTDIEREHGCGVADSGPLPMREKPAEGDRPNLCRSPDTQKGPSRLRLGSRPWSSIHVQGSFRERSRHGGQWGLQGTNAQNDPKIRTAESATLNPLSLNCHRTVTGLLEPGGRRFKSCHRRSVGQREPWALSARVRCRVVGVASRRAGACPNRGLGHLRLAPGRARA
jgi:hypothetical protein